MKQDTNKTKKNMRWWMRYLHNKIGFFIVALVIIYSMSGLLQTYRDTDILKHDVTHEMQVAPKLQASELGPKLRLRDVKITKTESNIAFFKEGTYNMETGAAKYTTKEWYSWVMPFTELHKSSANGVTHYFTTLFGIALFFMSISAFWMFKPGTKLFSSGVYITIGGIVASVILLILS
ncbi:MAG: hypothetical protein ABI861_03185 [Panacibacter sp.]